MAKSHGYVLLFVLIALSTMSMLILHAFQLLREKIEVAHQAERVLQIRLDSLPALQSLGLKIHENHSCLNPLTESETMIRPLTWWKAHACLFMHDNLQVYYFIAFSTRDDCGWITPTHRAQYQRFLVRVVKDQVHSLQAVFTSIAAVRAVNACETPVRRLHAGMQLLHMFNLVLQGEKD